jgi:hypothetical protein
MTKRITAMSFKENAMTSKRNEQDDQNQELQGGMNKMIKTKSFKEKRVRGSRLETSRKNK